MFKRTDNREGDLSRLQRVYDLLCRYEGRDRFVLRIESNGHAWQLTFPNSTTGFCPELWQELSGLLGGGTVHVTEGDNGQ